MNNFVAVAACALFILSAVDAELNMTANEIIEQSDLGLHNLEKAAAIYCVNPNSRSRIQGVALHFNVTGIASFRRFDSYRSELHHLETVNTVLHNTSPDKQTAKTTQIVRRYLTTTVSATSKTFDRNHEVGAGVKVTAGFDFIEKAEVEISGNYKYHNGSSEKTDTSITTTFEKTVTVPSQDIVIRPNSDLHVTTEFFSVREQVFYFVDLVISNATITTHDPAALAILGTYETTDLMPKLDELVDRPEFGEEDIQIGRKRNIFILKNIPYVVERSEYLAKTSYKPGNKLISVLTF